MQREFDLSLGKNPPRFSQATVPISGEAAAFVLLRDRSQETPRLDALTLGTLAAVLATAFGNVAAALGALRRRRRSAAE